LILLIMVSKLGFSEWPFHVLPDEDFVRIWCGRKELREKLDAIFSRLLTKPIFQIHLVYGDFGAGKTHSIKHMLNKPSAWTCHNGRTLASFSECNASFGTPNSSKTLVIPSTVLFLFSRLIPSQTET
jgi:hypothetical protein